MYLLNGCIHINTPVLPREYTRDQVRFACEQADKGFEHMKRQILMQFHWRIATVAENSVPVSLVVR